MSDTERPNLPTPSERRRRPLTKRDRQAFLEALSNGWSVRHAAVYAGRHWARFYTLRDREEAFAAEWAEAAEAGTDVLEHEAYRRAVEGVDEPVYQGGELVGTVRRYSDRLLEFLIRGRRPVYRDNVGRVELTGRAGGPLEIEDRSASLVDVARVLVSAGALDPARLLGVQLGDVVEGEATEVPPAIEP